MFECITDKHLLVPHFLLIEKGEHSFPPTPAFPFATRGVSMYLRKYFLLSTSKEENELNADRACIYSSGA